MTWQLPQMKRHTNGSCCSLCIMRAFKPLQAGNARAISLLHAQACSKQCRLCRPTVSLNCQAAQTISCMGLCNTGMGNVTIDEAVTIGRYRARITLAYVRSRISLHTSGVVVKREYEPIVHGVQGQTCQTALTRRSCSSTPHNARQNYDVSLQQYGSRPNEVLCKPHEHRSVDNTAVVRHTFC